MGNYLGIIGRKILIGKCLDSSALHMLSYLGIERGVFTPLVLSTWGGMGKEAATFYKRLADLLASKRQNPYPAVMDGLDAGYLLHQFALQ